MDFVSLLKYLSFIVSWGGEQLKEWVDDCVEIMNSFAENSECDTIEVHGRKGWEKILTKYGVEHSSSTYEKKVTHTTQ